jgi:predicted metal-binding protein
MKIDDLIKAALDAGFDGAQKLDCSTITLYPDVRAACELNRCGRYGKSWSCPPACGTLKECEDRLRRYSSGLIVQTTGKLEDEFDGEGMTETAQRHQQNLRTLSERLRPVFPDMLPIGTGSCSYCGCCTYPDAPCRNPREAAIPMEAYGMMVHEICRSNGMEYYHGKGTITFTGCFLIEATSENLSCKP